jgi:hypothetical protein
VLTGLMAVAVVVTSCVARTSDPPGSGPGHQHAEKGGDLRASAGHRKGPARR